MKYEKFLKGVSSFPLFGNDIGRVLGETLPVTQIQLMRWVKTGKVIRLKRGVYTLPESVRNRPYSLFWLANTLYSPSYLSLESMLSWYDLIPERVAVFTSVTTLKTRLFHNPLGRFVYRHLKQDLFFGFEEGEDEFHGKVLKATPEKALLDYIYLHPHWEFSQTFLEENVRLQQAQQLRKSRLRAYEEKFASRKMTMAIQVLMKYF